MCWFQNGPAPGSNKTRGITAITPPAFSEGSDWPCVCFYGFFSCFFSSRSGFGRWRADAITNSFRWSRIRSEYSNRGVDMSCFFSLTDKFDLIIYILICMPSTNLSFGEETASFRKRLMESCIKCVDTSSSLFCSFHFTVIHYFVQQNKKFIFEIWKNVKRFKRY